MAAIPITFSWLFLIVGVMLLSESFLRYQHAVKRFIWFYKGWGNWRTSTWAVSSSVSFAISAHLAHGLSRRLYLAGVVSIGTSLLTAAFIIVKGSKLGAVIRDWLNPDYDLD